MFHRLFTLSWLLLSPLLALAVERFPPPEFSDDYLMPVTTIPPARAEWMALLDIGLLAAALALAGYLALVRRSRAGLFALMLVSIAYFGFFRNGCVCPVGSLQNVALALAQPDYALPLAVGAFFLLPLVAALFVGRVFCAGVCPLGAMQDVVLLRPVRVPNWLEHALGVIPYLYLGAAVLFAVGAGRFLVCQYDPFVPLFRLSGPPGILLFGAVILGLSIFVGRPYCRFFCPYSVLLRWLTPLARRPVRVTPTKCTACRLCEDACPFGALRAPTPARHPGGRHDGKGRLALYLILLPVILAAGGALGYWGGALPANHHAVVRQADRVWLEEHGLVEGMTPESEAFYRQDEPPDMLWDAAAEIRRDYHRAGILLGAWFGLVIGMKLIFLSIRRRRTDYEPDQAACVACGRCYRFCPEDPVNRPTDAARTLEKRT